MSSLLRLYAAIENRVLDVVMTGKLLTRKTLAVTQEAKDTVPTDWYFLHHMMSEFDFREGDNIVDVGCGTGRVLAYLARRFPHARLTGIELNQKVAAIAAMVVPSKCEVIAGNILEVCPDTANVFYMFNPFYAEIMREFCEKILNNLPSFTVIYAVPVHLDTIEKYCNEINSIKLRTIKSKIRGIDRKYAIIIK
ncbi:class I SAM-dependent methyltransferase [Rhizorhabdus wittichii]|uniref:class I SAM-dependent methyltransferase n=1 Tax=Rhizorhabdus wittichii TaxID=160791 RepID=UPI0009D9FD3F|nr:class I SAM-dependent methyltransferase [Rhizorhabdus wittichii]